MSNKIVAGLLALSLVSCASFDSFVNTLRGDLVTLDFVYTTASSWYEANIAGTARENDCVTSINGSCNVPGTPPSKTVKQLHEEIRVNYQASKNALNALLDAYSASRKADAELLFKTVANLVLQVVNLIAVLNGPNLHAQIPENAYTAAIKSDLVKVK